MAPARLDWELVVPFKIARIQSRRSTLTYLTMSLAGDLKRSPFQELTRLAVGLGLESDPGPLAGNFRPGNRAPRPMRTIARAEWVPPHPASCRARFKLLGSGYLTKDVGRQIRHVAALSRGLLGFVTQDVCHGVVGETDPRTENDGCGRSGSGLRSQ